MAAIEYIVFFNNVAAEQKRLDLIEEVTVVQEADKPWEARLQIPVCVNNDGKWEGEDEAWMRAYNRVRVEAKIGEAAYVPLIDGPIVGFDTARSAQPGKSVVTLVVHDDSAFLNRQANVARYEGKTDSAIARQVFQEAGTITGGFDIPEETPPPPGNTANVTMQRGSKWQFLRELARRHENWHAYVLPGEEPGKSIGAFRKYRTEPDGLPPMLLLGDDRNIAEFNVTNNPRNPCVVRTSTLAISDKSVRTSTASYRDSTLLGDRPANDSDAGDEATCLMPPTLGDLVDPDSATGGASSASGYSSEATGSVIPHCYTGVLSPYRVVLVRISDSKLSGKYLITKVTHTLTRSTYTQAFEMKGNGFTEEDPASANAPQASASAGVSFNVQVSIF